MWSAGQHPDEASRKGTFSTEWALDYFYEGDCVKQPEPTVNAGSKTTKSKQAAADKEEWVYHPSLSTQFG